MENLELVKATENLTADIKRIIENSNLAYAEKSRGIMGRLRREYIYVRNSYVKTFDTNGTVSLNPESPDIKCKLDENEREGIQDDEYTRIYAYSFGPWNPIEYFNDDNFKVVFLLKEPLLDDIEQMRCRSEGADQAYDFKTWKDIRDDERGKGTKTGIIRLISKLLLNIRKTADNQLDNIQDDKRRGQIIQLKNEDITTYDDDKDDYIDDVFEKVMKHICIIEINHFPGLNLKKQTYSELSLIKKWSSINKSLLRLLIDFYSDILVIGDYDTLNLFVSDNLDKLERDEQVRVVKLLRDEGLFNWLLDFWKEESYPDLDLKICGRVARPQIMPLQAKLLSNKRELKKPTAIRDINNCLWVAWYHPSFYLRAGYKNLDKVAEWIVSGLRL